MYKRSPAKAEAWVAKFGGRAAPTPKAAAAGQDIVFCCVGNDDDLRQVTLGPDGAIHGMAAGSLFVDHTTASADVARDLHAVFKAHGVGFVDAPVSGGQGGARTASSP